MQPDRSALAQLQPFAAAVGMLSHNSGVLPPYRPQLATLAQQPPPDDAAVGCELKKDGWRAGLYVDGGHRARLVSRHGRTWSDSFPTIVQAGLRLPVKSVLLDGELAVLMPNGLTNFHALQQQRHSLPAGSALVLFVFDVISLDGEDVAALPYVQRKDKLRSLLERSEVGGVLRYVDHIVGNAAQVLAHACELGVEGIVCKRLDARYRPGRSRDWLKLKCSRTKPFVIGGFTPSGDHNAVSSLLVGYYDTEGVLRYAGNVGTGKGFTRDFLRELRAQLVQIEQARSPFAGFAPSTVRSPWSKGRSAPVVWVNPAVVVDVAFLEIGNSGGLRHPSFQRFRTDLHPQAVIRDESW